MKESPIASAAKKIRSAMGCQRGLRLNAAEVGALVHHLADPGVGTARRKSTRTTDLEQAKGIITQHYLEAAR